MNDDCKRGPQVSSSMRISFGSCPRKVYWRYVAGLQLRSGFSMPLTWGKAFHRGLEVLRQTRTVGVARIAGADAFREMVNEVKPDLTPDEIDDTAAAIDAAIAGYTARFFNDFMGTAPEDWETEFRIDQGEELAFIDALYRDQFGKVWMIEDKTRSAFDPNVPVAMAMDEQLMNYTIMLQDAGFDVGGIIYRETRKPRIRRNKNETGDGFSERVQKEYLSKPQEYFREFILNYSAIDLQAYFRRRKSVNGSIKKLLAKESITSWPIVSSSCLGKYGPCDFLWACNGRKDLIANRYEPNGKEPLDGGKKIIEFSTADDKPAPNIDPTDPGPGDSDIPFDPGCPEVLPGPSSLGDLDAIVRDSGIG